MLRERREAMGVTLAEVEVATRIRQKYLSALEAEDWHLLPGEVVGRGFLRNYADYLGLDPQEIMDRRRAITDVGMTQALSTTSAGAPLPPEREVDYRPKEVELKDEGDGIQRGEIRLTPILAIIGVAVVVGLGLWGLSMLREPLSAMLSGAQAGVMEIFDRPDPTATTTVSSAIGVINEQNLNNGQAAGTEMTPAVTTDNSVDEGVVVLGSGSGTAPAEGTQGGGGEVNPPPPAAPVGQEGGVILVPTATPGTEAILAPTATPEVPAAEAVAPMAEVPTATPEMPTATPEPPTPTLEPPTATPELPPTETPTPEPPPAPVVVAASCGDPRSVISAPGVNQALAGVTTISGVATHEAFQFYKLEYAPGANAGGGYTYFGGGQVQIAGGVLGNLDTTVLPNGEYTIRLTVVDQVGNFPPPCDVSVIVQN
ncbi:MAG: helix-turn-helix domain-containing protein [Caldilineaceae bacterium]|nr:helix-turn-helix domain-containing protein [Caldilineaceae bacterium]